MRNFSPSFITCCMRRNLFLTLFAILSAVSAWGQVFYQNTMFAYNRFPYNPATAGMSQGTNFAVMGRQQWVGIAGRPEVYTASVNGPTERLGGGAGLTVAFDRLGPLTTLGLNGSYAFHFKFGNKAQYNLNLGVQGGLHQKSINTQVIYNSAVIDPIIGVSSGQFWNSSSMVPSLGTGLYFSAKGAGLDSTAERFWIGISGLDLLEPTLKLNVNNAPTLARVQRSFTVMSGYRIDFNERTSLSPMVFLRTDGTTGSNGLPFQFDAAAHLNISSVVLGLQYRWQESVSAVVGADVSKYLFMGYSYDYTVNNLSRGGVVGSHEVIMSYTLPTRTKADPGKIDTYSDDK
jgi:type IX secretion system PorP/SprF family membrane protein